MMALMFSTVVEEMTACDGKATAISSENKARHRVAGQLGTLRLRFGLLIKQYANRITISWISRAIKCADRRSICICKCPEASRGRGNRNQSNPRTGNIGRPLQSIGQSGNTQET